MILTSIGPDAPFHRAFTPRWAHAPESGAGAALAGGRFNRPGVEARYLAATAETALAEYQGESPLLPPTTLVTFLVTAKNVVDFTGGYDPTRWSRGKVCGAVMDTAVANDEASVLGRVVRDVLPDAPHLGSEVVGAGVFELPFGPVVLDVVGGLRGTIAGATGPGGTSASRSTEGDVTTKRALGRSVNVSATRLSPSSTLPSTFGGRSARKRSARALMIDSTSTLTGRMSRAVQNFTAYFGFGGKVLGDWFEYEGKPFGRGPWRAPRRIARSKMRVCDSQ